MLLNWKRQQPSSHALKEVMQYFKFKVKKKINMADFLNNANTKF